MMSKFHMHIETKTPLSGVMHDSKKIMVFGGMCETWYSYTFKSRKQYEKAFKLQKNLKDIKIQSAVGAI
jgi:hypothetical protein